jgi:uncharacterized Fe-S cluster-containing protein
MVVVAAESETNESAKLVVVVVDGVQYDVVTSEALHCRACLAVLRVSFSSDIYREICISIPITHTANDFERKRKNITRT